MPPARFSMRVQPRSASSSHAIVLRPPAAQVTSMAWSRAGSSPSRSSSSSTGTRCAPGMCPAANSAGVRTSSTKTSGCCCRSTSAGAGSMARYGRAAQDDVARRRLAGGDVGQVHPRRRRGCARAARGSRPAVGAAERISASWRSAARSRCDSCHTTTARAARASPSRTLSMRGILALTPPMRHAHRWAMRAILVREPGDESVLGLGDAPRAGARALGRSHPDPGDGAQPGRPDAAPGALSAAARCHAHPRDGVRRRGRRGRARGARLPASGSGSWRCCPAAATPRRPASITGRSSPCPTA